MSDPHKETNLLSLREAAEILDVHYMTAYRYVRLGMLPATQQGRRWAVRREDLAAFSETPPASTERGDADWDERLLARMLEADVSGAWGVTEAALASGMTLTGAYEQLLVPALRRVGDLWVAGDISVADEHAASQVATRIVARLAPRMARPGRRRGTVVLGSTQTETHGLALSIAADLFRNAQFDVVDLGTNLPAESLAASVASRTDVTVVALSITNPGQGVEIARSIGAVRAVKDVKVVVGGGGISEEEALAAGADGYARTARDAIILFEEFRQKV
jgi:excisionase family DNA binding protein